MYQFIDLELFKGYDYLPTSDNSQMSTSAHLSTKNGLWNLTLPHEYDNLFFYIPIPW